MGVKPSSPRALEPHWVNLFVTTYNIFLLLQKGILIVTVYKLKLHIYGAHYTVCTRVVQYSRAPELRAPGNTIARVLLNPGWILVRSRTPMFRHPCSILPSVSFYHYNFLLLYSTYTWFCLCHYKTPFLILILRKEAYLTGKICLATSTSYLFLVQDLDPPRFWRLFYHKFWHKS